MKYLQERRAALGGYLPQRRQKADEQLKAPALDAFKAVLEPTAEGREISTTQAFVRILNQVLRDKELGPRLVPIVADEARTFGMEGLFRQIGIYAPYGQKYTPVDADQVMYYRETANGQLLQEGINEQGAFSSWIAAATSYSNSNRIMIPFFIYYSMFGFQRTADSGLGGLATCRRAASCHGTWPGAIHAERRRPAARGDFRHSHIPCVA